MRKSVNMSYLSPLFAFILGVAGWFRPDQTPLWLSCVFVIFLFGNLIAEVIIRKRKEEDKEVLKKEIGDIHDKSNARSRFEMSVSGTVVSEERQLISLPKENAYLVFELRLRNIGNAMAKNIQAFLWAPNNLDIPSLSNHWIPNGVPLQPGHPDNPEVEGAFEYLYHFPYAIYPGNWLTMSHWRLKRGIDGKIPFRLKVYAEGGLFQEWTFVIVQSAQ